MFNVMSATTYVCFRWCYLIVTAQQEVMSPLSWLQDQNAIQNGCLRVVGAVPIYCVHDHWIMWGIMRHFDVLNV